jgi:hypothetical protein
MQHLPTGMFSFRRRGELDSVRREGLLSTDAIVRRGAFPPPMEAAVSAEKAVISEVPGYAQ